MLIGRKVFCSDHLPNDIGADAQLLTWLSDVSKYKRQCFVCSRAGSEYSAGRVKDASSVTSS